MMKINYFAIIAICLAGLLAFAGCSGDDNPMDMNNNQDKTVQIQTSPMDGATNIPRNTAFVVTFSRAMDANEAQMHFMLHPGWGVGMMEMEGMTSWNDARTRMTFQPSMMLDSNMTYTMHFDGMMRGMDGMMMRPMMDTMGGMGGMGEGMMMGGMGENDLRLVCSTGPSIRRQIDLNLSGDVVLVVDGASGDIAAIDPLSNSLVGIQPLRDVKFIHHINVSPDRTRLIVADPGEDLSSGEDGGHNGHHPEGEVVRSKLLVLDSRTLLEISRLDIEGIIHNGLITTDGSSLLFANTEHNSLHRYSFPGLTSVSSYPVGAGPLEVTITPDGQYALTANSEAGTVSRVHLTMDMPSDVVQVGQTPVGAWMSPDGMTAWVTNEGSKSVTVLTVSPFAVDTTIALGFTPGQAMVNPVRAEAYVADEDNGKVAIFDSGTYARLGEIATGMGAHGIAFSPDGSKAYVTNEHAMSVTVINTSTRTIVATVQVGMKPNGIIYRTAL